jgi:hypothetical protein
MVRATVSSCQFIKEQVVEHRKEGIDVQIPKTRISETTKYLLSTMEKKRG